MAGNAQAAIFGLDELKAEFARLPAILTAEGGRLARTAAVRAAAQIRGGYPTGRTGNLKRGVVLRAREGDAIGFLVLSTAPHAFLYEEGTRVRKTSGVPRRQGRTRRAGPFTPANRGAVRPHPTFVPAVVEQKRELDAGLRALLARYGIEVTG